MRAWKTVHETEWHNQIFKMTEGSVECSFSLIPLFDPDEVVGVSEVELGEDGSGAEGLEGGIDEGE